MKEFEELVEKVEKQFLKRGYSRGSVWALFDTWCEYPIHWELNDGNQRAIERLMVSLARRKAHVVGISTEAWIVIREHGHKIRELAKRQLLNLANDQMEGLMIHCENKTGSFVACARIVGRRPPALDAWKRMPITIEQLRDLHSKEQMPPAYYQFTYEKAADPNFTV